MIKPLDRTGTWRMYSLSNGLAGVRTEHIAEDSEGYLWFATWDNGVSRFSRMVMASVIAIRAGAFSIDHG